jgi:hypothetical protein
MNCVFNKKYLQICGFGFKFMNLHASFSEATEAGSLLLFVLSAVSLLLR